MENFESTKRLIMKHTGCQRVLKQDHRYLLFYIKTHSKTPYEIKELHQDEIRNIYLNELGI